MPVQSIRPRNKSLGGLVSALKNVPSLEQLISEGRASDERIRANEQAIRRSTKATLIEWLDQARRLWMATGLHGLAGARFVGFAQQIGINRSRAYELLKLHQYRDAVMTRCVEEETDQARRSSCGGC